MVKLMRGAIKHIVLLIVAAIIIIFLAIPVLRRMEPRHDVVPPPVDTSHVATPPAEKKPQVIDEQEGTQKPVVTPGQGEWRPVVSWEGTGPTNTKRFTIITNAWRIKWETEIIDPLGVGAFQIQVFEGGALKSVAANTTRTDRGVTNLAGPGTYTLSVNTLQKWKAAIEER